MLQFYSSVKERYQHKQQQMRGITDQYDVNDEMNKNDNDDDDTRIEMEIVFCCMDDMEIAYEMCTRDMPWWCVPFHAVALRDLLFRLYCGVGIPHATILDHRDGPTKNGRSNCSSSGSSGNGNNSKNGVLVFDGLTKIMTDPAGLAFPWRPNQRLVDLLPGHYLIMPRAAARRPPQPCQSSCLHRRMSDLNDKYLFIYAAAQWCESSREFTTKLSQLYTELQQHGKNVEVRDCFCCWRTVGSVKRTVAERLGQAFCRRSSCHDI
jgi:hypothetical protein